MPIHFPLVAVGSLVEIEKVKKAVGTTPYMDVRQARIVTDIILENQYTNLLELGFKHGVSTCYFAAALDEMQKGTITTIDLETAKLNKPNLETLINKLELSKYVSPVYEAKSYNWTLMGYLQQSPVPQFDFRYLDGAHDWYVDGLAFELVDKLLAPGGAIVFDDLDWTYSKSEALAKTDFVKNLPPAEVNVPHVRLVYELLVKTNKNYVNFSEKNGWAIAYKAKSANSNADQPEIRSEVIYKEIGLGAYLDKASIKIKQKVKSIFTS